MKQWSISPPVWTDPGIWQQSGPVWSNPAVWQQSGPVFSSGVPWQQSPPVIVTDPSATLSNVSSMLPWVIGGVILYYALRRK